ncbi:hypothetical protein CRG98_037582 [Punica granatum]|nr:hypothetical protein CRG98_037582 [Punica granatum]
MADRVKGSARRRSPDNLEPDSGGKDGDWEKALDTEPDVEDIQSRGSAWSQISTVLSVCKRQAKWVDVSGLRSLWSHELMKLGIELEEKVQLWRVCHMKPEEAHHLEEVQRWFGLERSVRIGRGGAR